MAYYDRRTGKFKTKVFGSRYSREVRIISERLRNADIPHECDSYETLFSDGRGWYHYIEIVADTAEELKALYEKADKIIQEFEKEEKSKEEKAEKLGI